MASARVTNDVVGPSVLPLHQAGAIKDERRHPDICERLVDLAAQPRSRLRCPGRWPD
jgi:hypothetical protein